jgi:hypothetical protein
MKVQSFLNRSLQRRVCLNDILVNQFCGVPGSKLRQVCKCQEVEPELHCVTGRKPQLFTPNG